MPALAALALLATASAPQETVTFRFNPPLDRVLEFVVALQGERLDGTSLLNVRVVVAQRAKAQGANFRLSRYVSFASGEGSGPLGSGAKEFAALNGRTFPLLVSPEGKKLPLKRGKYENDPRLVPTFNFGQPGPFTVGQEVAIPNGDLGPAGRATLREVRTIGDQRAAIFAFTGTPDGNVEASSGTMVISANDGMVLLVDLNGRTRATKADPAARLHLRIQRQNVPGLDRLVADLQIED